jgi:hypothetical protein
MVVKGEGGKGDCYLHTLANVSTSSHVSLVFRYIGAIVIRVRCLLIGLADSTRLEVENRSCRHASQASVGFEGHGYESEVVA